jgi:hypothetical protein
MTTYLSCRTYRVASLNTKGQGIPIGPATFIGSQRIEVSGTATVGTLTSVSTATYTEPQYTVFELSNDGSQTAGEETGATLYVRFRDTSSPLATVTTAGVGSRLTLRVGETAQVHSDSFGQVVVAIEAILTPS